MNILQLEILKILKNKMNFVILIGIFLLIGIFMLSPSHTAESEIEFFKSEISSNENTQAEVKNIPEAATVLDDTEEVLSYLNPLVISLESENYQDALEYEYQYENKLLEDMRAGKLVGLSILEQERIVAELNYLIENDYIKDRGTKPIDSSLSQFLLSLFSSSTFSSLLILIAVSLLIVQLVTYDKRKQTYHLVNIFPVKSNIVIAIKYAVITSFSLFSIFLPIILTSIIIGFKNGLGNFAYPISYLADNSYIEIIPISEYITQHIILILLWVIAISLISFFLYQFSGNLFLHTIFILSFLLVSQSGMVANLFNESHNSFIGYLPSSYIDIQTVVIGGTGYYPLVSSNITFANGIISLSALSLLLSVLIILINLKRKSYNNALF